MSGIIIPPFIGAPEEAPASSSSLLVYDELWVREPRLMVPLQGAVGSVRFSHSHQFLSSVISTGSIVVGFLNDNYYNLKDGGTKLSGARNPGYNVSPVRWSNAGKGPYSYGFDYQLVNNASCTKLVMFGLVEFVSAGSGNACVAGCYENENRVAIYYNSSTGLAAKFGDTAASTGLDIWSPGKTYGFAWQVNGGTQTLYVNGRKLAPGSCGASMYLFGLSTKVREYTNESENICAGMVVMGRDSLIPEGMLQQMSINPMACVIPA